MNIKELNLGEKVILVGCIASIVSLFLPWVDIGFARVNGFQQQGYIIILFWLYPCVQAIRQNKASKGISAVLTVLGLFIMIYMIKEKSASFLGSSMNFAGSGMYLMIASLIAVLVGVFINKR